MEDDKIKCVNFITEIDCFQLPKLRFKIMYLSTSSPAEIEELLLAITTSTDLVVEQTQTKPKEASEVEITKAYETFFPDITSKI